MSLEDQTFNFSLFSPSSTTFNVIRLLYYNYLICAVVICATFPQFYSILVQNAITLAIINVIFLVTDLLLKLAFTPKLISYKKNTRLMSKIVKYLKYYLIDYFLLVDTTCLIVFAINQFNSAFYARLLCLIILTKFSDIGQINNIFYRKLQKWPKSRSLYTLTKIIYVLLMFSHIFACIFYYMDQTLIDQSYYGSISSNPQLYYQAKLLCFTPIQALNQYGRYLYALYFMVSLMTTIAYGDIIGKNPIQDIFVTVMMVVSTISIALILEQFIILVRGSIFAADDFVFYVISKQFSFLKSLMKTHGVPRSVRNQVRNYLFYVELQTQQSQNSSSLNKLTDHLRKQALYYGKRYHKYNISQGYSSHYQKPLRLIGISNPFYLSELIQQVHFHADNSAITPQFSANQHDFSETIHGFLSHMNGEYATYIKKDIDSSQIQLTVKLSSFGLYQMVSCTKAAIGVKCLTFCNFIYLNTNDFQKYLQQNQSDRRNVRKTKTKFLLNQFDRKKFDLQCKLCDNADHDLRNCPQAHFVIDSSIAKANKIHQILATARYCQQRQPFKRKIMKRLKIKNFTVAGSLASIIMLMRNNNNSNNVFNQQKQQKLVANSLLKILQRLNKQQSNKQSYQVYESDQELQQFNILPNSYF